MVQVEPTDEAREMYTLWSAQLEAAQSELTEVQRKVAGLTQVIAGLTTMYPWLSGQDRPVRDRTAPKPRVPNASRAEAMGAAAGRAVVSTGLVVSKGVVQVIRENPDQLFTVEDMVHEFERRKWAGSKMAIRLGMRRAAERGTFERDDTGPIQAFRLAPAGRTNTMPNEVSTP